MAIEAATTATVTAVSTANAKQFQHLFDYVIAARVVLEEDSIASGASSAAVYTITGANPGDFVMAAIIDDAGDDILVSAQVTAANEVTVIVTDGSAGANTALATAVNVNLIVLGVNDGLFDNAGSY